MPNDSADPGTGGILQKAAAKAKQTVGNLLGNEDLTEEGQLQEARIDASSDAVRKAAEAKVAEDAADVAAAQEANRVEQQRIAAELAASDAAASIDHAEADAATALEQTAAEREATIERAHAAEQAIIDRQAAAAEAEHLEDLAEATTLDQDAERAAAIADGLEAARQNLDNQTKGA